MLSELKSSDIQIGIKQSRRSLGEGKVAKAFVAGDADANVTRLFVSECETMGVEVLPVESMKELGNAAGIDVGAAVVVILKV